MLNIDKQAVLSASAGKEATAHESPVPFAGSTSIGYILFDPVTGGGAYKIDGGSNGAFVKGIAKVLEAFGFYYAYKEFLAALAGSKGVAKSLSKAGNVLFALSFLFSVFDIALNCDVGEALLSIIVMTIMIVRLLSFIAFALTGFGALLGLVLLSALTSSFTSFITSSNACKD